MRIGLLTGGGDAPGLNAVIRAVVLTASNRGRKVLGIRHGFNGLLIDGDVEPLTRESVRGIGHMGGTILRTTSRGNPFHLPVRGPDGVYTEIDRSDELLANAKRHGIDEWGKMVALQSPHIVTVPITEVLKELKRVDPLHDIVRTAREMGISMGD